MVRSALSKVAWVGRTASMVFGLALVLAPILGVATTAFGANGDFFKVGKANLASAVSVLTKSRAGPALSLRVGSGAPLAVNSPTKVANLNADKVDGQSFSCPSGTRLHEGVCIERTRRSTDALAGFLAAETDCLNERGTRLPTPGELQTIEGRTDTEWSNHAYTDHTDTTSRILVIVVASDGRLSSANLTNSIAHYRCVKQPT